MVSDFEEVTIEYGNCGRNWNEDRRWETRIENDESAGASNLFYGYPTDFYGRFCYFGWRNGRLG